MNYSKDRIWSDCVSVEDTYDIFFYYDIKQIQRKKLIRKLIEHKSRYSPVEESVTSLITALSRIDTKRISKIEFDVNNCLVNELEIKGTVIEEPSVNYRGLDKLTVKRIFKYTIQDYIKDFEKFLEQCGVVILSEGNEYDAHITDYEDTFWEHAEEFNYED